MKKILKNTKGFTLVELLAVIVVLAVIILIAMPSVMNSMEKARKNAFATEANEIIRIAQTAYADAVMEGKTGNKFCVTYAYLSTKGFIEKNTGTYQGSVLINIDPNGKATYKIWLSNDNYKITAAEPDVTTNAKYFVATTSKDASESCGGETGVTLLDA